MVSAKLLNNFAFLVISLTMLGFAMSAVWLALRWQRIYARREEALLLAAALFGLTLVAVTIVFYRAPSGEQWADSRGGFMLAFLYLLPFALGYALPFAACGLILGLLLSDPALPTRRIYFWDLVGSAAGAMAVIPAIGGLGAERSALAGAILLLAGAASLTSPRRGAARLVAGLAAGTLLAAFLLSGRLFVMTYPRQSYLGVAQVPGSGYAIERIAWDPVARIEFLRTPPPDPRSFPWPALIGGNPDFLSRFRRMLTQNNNAFTYAVDYDGRRESLSGIEQTIYAAAYEASAVPRPRVLVIGVGGGFDVLTALRFDASRVVGVEVNAATIRLLTRSYRDYFRAWVEDPRLSLVHAEGRHYLARDPGLYDVIQLSGVDSVSGTPAAAHVFSESYLYTAEAFDLYLARLSNAGILNLMRMEETPPREMLRVLVTAVESLRRSGLRPSGHLAVVASNNGSFVALLAKRTPFTREEVERLGAWTSGPVSFHLAAAPGLRLPDNIYQAFLALDDPAREASFVARYPFDIRPVSDDRPFFFRFSRWGHLFPRDPWVRASVPLMEEGLLLLLLSTGLAAWVCIYLPLRHLSRAGQALTGAARHVVFFSAIGVGFMAIEVALLQQFSLFLGHPNYALSVVLAALLVTSGTGALFSEKTVRLLGRVRYVSYVLAVVVLAEYLLVFPRLATLVSLPFASRVAIVFALVAPIGLCLGAFFPWALERIKETQPAFVPWAWGLNGIASVVAPVLSVGVSMTWGISALLIAALPVYLLAGIVLPEPRPRSG